MIDNTNEMYYRLSYTVCVRACVRVRACVCVQILRCTLPTAWGKCLATICTAGRFVPFGGVENDWWRAGSVSFFS